MGTSFVISSRVRKSQDHPHACGDKALFQPRLRQTQGSSPRVWGQVFLVPIPVITCGIIPTRVGTSRSRRNCSRNVEDHPHACGDKGMRSDKALRRPGSSPRVWGQATSSFVKLRRLGIIPTRVGTRQKRITAVF